VFSSKCAPPAQRRVEGKGVGGDMGGGERDMGGGGSCCHTCKTEFEAVSDRDEIYKCIELYIRIHVH
jgi:hypothetical protein